MDPAQLRAQYPVFESVAYLNAGTCGPLPGAALRAAADSGLPAAEEGRAMAYFTRLTDLRDRLRTTYAELLGADPGTVSVTTSTSDGMTRVLLGLDLGRGDEVLTADDEHPGLLGPLAAATRRLGISVREVPLEEIADEVGPRTKLVACSHVSWISGRLAPAELREVGRSVPVLLDGAQGAGAIPTDVAALGCAFYAAAGQKWLCGPVGTGMLWVSPAWRERLDVLAPTYVNLSIPNAGLDAQAWPDARALDAPAMSAETYAAAIGAHDVLALFGWEEVHARSADLAARLAQRLRETGHDVLERDHTTLVAWRDADPVATSTRLAAAGITIRPLPGDELLRAAVGAWNDESDLDRLVTAL